MRIEYLGAGVAVAAPPPDLKLDGERLRVLVCHGKRYRACTEAGFTHLWTSDGPVAAYEFLTADWELRGHGGLNPSGPAFRAETRWIDSRTVAVLLIIRSDLRFDLDALNIDCPNPFDVVGCS